MTMKPRSMPDFSLEDALQGPVCGLDEAGRGPLVGPVTAACVFVPPRSRDQAFWSRVNDSKALTSFVRESLFESITSHCVFGIAHADPAEIDSLNILQASLLAMRRAFEILCAKMDAPPSHALVDGNAAPPGLGCAVVPVIKGDARSRSIAAASILAKISRDRILLDLATQHPHYGWETNAGYPTAQHIDAINAHGLTVHHRHSFAPVRNFLTFGDCRAGRTIGLKSR
ncbi:MAG TPA: ribonuclease HII [Alphaproteobacteria bacterium]|nr:ribonuclease HII [Alphaproteobacteria bacterium]